MSKIPKSRLALGSSKKTEPPAAVPPTEPPTKVEPPPTKVEPPITKVEPPITKVEPPPAKVEPPIIKVEPPTRNTQDIFTKPVAQNETVTSALRDIIRNMTRKSRSYPKEKLSRPKSKQTCVFIGMNANEYDEKKTLSWCLADPTRNTGCNITFCFDVTRVRQHMQPYIEANTHPDHIPMYERSAIQDAFGKDIQFKDYIVPEFMSPEFRLVIENFESIPTDAMTLESDPISRTIIRIMSDYLKEKTEKTGQTEGVFWTYAKRVFEIGKNLLTNEYVQYLLANPFWLMLATTAVKILRISFCIYLSFGQNAKAIFESFKASIIEKVRGVAFGIPVVIVEVVGSIVECLMTSGGNPISVIGCVILNTAPKALWGFWEILKYVLQTFLSVFNRSGWFNFFSVGVGTALTEPSTLFRVLFGDVKGGIAMDVATALHDFSVQQWGFVALMAIFTFLKEDHIEKLFDGMIYFLEKAGHYLGGKNAKKKVVKKKKDQGQLMIESEKQEVTEELLMMIEYKPEPLTVDDMETALTLLASSGALTTVAVAVPPLAPLVTAASVYYGSDQAKTAIAALTGYLAGTAGGGLAGGVLGTVVGVATTNPALAVKLAKYFAYYTGTAAQYLALFIKCWKASTGLKHPIIYIARMTKIYGEINWIAEALREVYEWIYDLGGCLLNKLIRMIKSAIGIIDTVNANETCCMTEAIVLIQQQLNSTLSYSRWARFSRWFLSSGFIGYAKNMTTEELKEGRDSMADFLMENPFVYEDDPAMQKALLEFINEENNYIPNEFYKEFAPEQQTKTKKGYFSRLMASLSDEREKIKVLPDPVFTLFVDGKPIHFYLFVWKQDAMFQDGHKMHVSVMAQEIQKLYPNAVFEYQDRYFVLLEHLPLIIVRHMIMFQNPIVDLSKYLRFETDSS